MSDNSGIERQHVGDQAQAVPNAAGREQPLQAEQEVPGGALAQPAFQLRWGENLQRPGIFVRARERPEILATDRIRTALRKVVFMLPPQPSDLIEKAHLVIKHKAVIGLEVAAEDAVTVKADPNR